MKRGAALVVILALGLAAPAFGDNEAGAGHGLDGRLRAALRSGFAASRLGAAGPDALVPCIIEGRLRPDEAAAHGVRIGTEAAGRFTARIPLSRLESVAWLPGVQRIRAASRLEPVLDFATVDSRSPLVWSGLPDSARGLTGQGVLVGVLDTGIDWAHPDFRTPGDSTRIAAIWDQTDPIGPPPAGHAYGSSWSAADIDLGLCRERDSTFYGHGTHVAGIAAGSGRGTGNGEPAFTFVGVAPRSHLGVVNTIFWSSAIVDGVAWLFDQAALLGVPAVVNLSLGGSNGPHDGTTDMEIMLNALSGPGRIIVAGAGNQNGKGSHGERIVPGGGEGIISFRIFSYTPSASVSEGVHLAGWYNGGDNLAISLRSPLGFVVGPVAKGTVLSIATPHGWVMIDQTGTEAYNVNGDIEVFIEISDDGGLPVAQGDWEILLSGVSTASGGEIDFWITDHAFPFPPAFVLGREEAELVLHPASADSVIAVAAHTTRTTWTAIDNGVYGYGQVLNGIANFSSVGPRRDGVLKPDLSAPGTAIGSAHSSTSRPNPVNIILPDGIHKILQGTSMSSPHTAGAVAILLEQWPWLSARQARTALAASARSDAMTGAVPNPVWGAGRLDLERLFVDRLAFSLSIDPEASAPAGGQAPLVSLCVAPGSGTWQTAWRVRVHDTRGWLHHADGGPPAPVALYTEVLPPVGPGGEVCAPQAGDLTIEVPVTAEAGEFTTVTFEVEPLKLPFLKETVTTVITVGGTSDAGIGALPRALGLTTPRGGSEAPHRFGLALPGSGPVDLRVADVQGRFRATIWKGGMKAGLHEVRWDGRDDAGRKLGSGVYFVRLESGGRSISRRIVLIP